MRTFLHTIYLRNCLIFSFFTTILLLTLSCEKKCGFFDNPKKFLETKSFPAYFQKIPYYGVNGRNGLSFFKPDTLIEIKGIYVKGKFFPFLRVFDDTGLYYIPLEDSLSFHSETSLLDAKGLVKKNREPCLVRIEVNSSTDVSKIKNMVEKEYPLFISKVADEIHNPSSKLDLSSVEDWHCACSGDALLVFGRIYDLMYEFDIGILLKKEGDSFTLKKIYAREFFKGE